MKKWLLGLLTAMMAVSLAACTPTTEKKQETTTTAAAAKQEQIEAQTTGGASDKVPDPNVAPVAIISVYHKGDGDSLVQDMDSLDNDELDPQALVSKMTEYGIFTEGTQVLNFNITGNQCQRLWPFIPLRKQITVQAACKEGGRLNGNRRQPPNRNRCLLLFLFFSNHTPN